MTPSATTTDNRLLSSRHSAPDITADITVADSEQAEDWLAEIALRARRSWQVRQLGTGIPRGLLVLTQPGACPKALRHWIAAPQVVVSLDSPQGRSLALSNRVQTFTFSEGRDAADLTAKDLRMTKSGLLRFVAVTKEALTRVTVEPEQLYPALAAMACAVWLDVSLELAGQVVSSERRGSGKIIRIS